jgi:chloramphenicol 3-O phosphotransferase
MAGQGNNLIADEVLLGDAKQRAYRQLLTGFEVSLIGLFAPLDVLQARERARERASGRPADRPGAMAVRRFPSPTDR